jgi:hypothetical protein
MRYLHRCRQVIREQWENGNFQAESDRETARANDAALAEMKVLRELTELDYDRYEGVMNDGE